MNFAVIGLGFGDEGKGLVTDWLCSSRNIDGVIRYSGGQQAGHTVVKDETRHVFAGFGSGTFRGVKTLWTKQCTFDPMAFKREHEILLEKGFKPELLVDRMSPVTTPLEIHKNRKMSYVVDGTCGSGVGTTWEREENNYSLRFIDLYFPSVLHKKMELLLKWYTVEHNLRLQEKDLESFLHSCLYVIRHTKNVDMDDLFNNHRNYVYEGSQGLMLDMEIGFFPHVTRSHTGRKGIEALGYHQEFQTFFVTRAYQTRHGNGPMTTEHIEHGLEENPNETNVNNAYQGEFRKGLLDLDLIRYALARNGVKHQDSLVVTCVDHLEDKPRLVHEGKVREFSDTREFLIYIKENLYLHTLYYNESEEGNLKELK
jgi:adenylosuccinate synthase